jgi:hypothetical protein
MSGIFQKVYVVLTHATRLACIIQHLRFVGTKEEKLPRKRLKNIAVVKMEKTFHPDRTSSVVLSLVYEGTLPKSKENDAGYWEMKNQESIVLTLTEEDSKKYFGDLSEMDILIYFVRHGQAVHNQLKFLYKKLAFLTPPEWPAWDSLLVSVDGIQEAGTAIVNDIYTYENINLPKSLQSIFFISSPLRRCMETMFFLLVGMNQAKMVRQRKQINQTTQNYTVYILPCLHEIDTVQKRKGQCDNSGNKLKTNTWGTTFTPENTSKCLKKLHNSSSVQGICSNFQQLFGSTKKSSSQQSPVVTQTSTLLASTNLQQTNQNKDCNMVKNLEDKTVCLLEKLLFLLSKNKISPSIQWSIFMNNKNTDCSKSFATSFLSFLPIVAQNSNISNNSNNMDNTSSLLTTL